MSGSEPSEDSRDLFTGGAPPAWPPKGYRSRKLRPTPETGLIETLVIALLVLVVVNAGVWIVVILVAGLL